MKHIITLLLLVFCISVSSAQNFYRKYNKKEFRKILHSVDTDTTTNVIMLSDSVSKHNMYLKYSITGNYHDNQFTKIVVVVDNKIEILTEIFYFDSQGFLLYYRVEEHRFNILMGVFEIKFYSKDDIFFFMDGSPTYFKSDEREMIVSLIKEDLKIYKQHLTH